MNHMRTIGSRKISDTSNSGTATQHRARAASESRLGSRFQLSLLIRLWRGNSARLIDARPCVAGRLARSFWRSRTEDNVLKTAQLQQAMSGDDLGRRAARRHKR